MDATTTMADAATCSSNWQDTLVERLQSLQSGFVDQGDEWLDYFAAVDLTSKTSTHDVTWTAEWNQFTTFGDWPQWDLYQQAILTAARDGWQGVQSVAYGVWITLQPFLYSAAYLVFRFLQVTVGAFLPYFQWMFVGICKFQLHATWQILAGEIAAVALTYIGWRFYKWCSTQQYTTRIRKAAAKNWNKAKQSIQDTYKEIAQVSLLLAMAIPHAAYIGFVVALKMFYPSWVAKISTETVAPALLNFYYPIMATIVVLHHSRALVGESAKSKTGKLDNNNNNNKKGKSKESKRKNKRRRSSIGALIHGTAPGSLPDGHEPGTDQQVVYTEDELTEDVAYWLNYWLLYSSLKAAYLLATSFSFVGSLLTSDTIHSVLCQLEFLFYLWIFCLPQCLLVLFPSAGDEERRDWSPTKQWCYKCAHSPILAIPAILNPISTEFYKKISQAVPAPLWKKYVVDWVKKTLDMASLLKIVSAERVEAFVDHLTDFRPMVIPSITLCMPALFTIYGVLYVQYIVPQAHSFNALGPKLRHTRNTQRILYLKFWVVQAFASVFIKWAHTLFWLVPFKTHITFILWCVLVMPRFISSIYDEFDRELQAFRLLPPVADGLSMENTYTFGAVTMLYKAVPKAADVDGTPNQNQGDDRAPDAGGEANNNSNNEMPAENELETISGGNKDTSEKTEDNGEESTADHTMDEDRAANGVVAGDVEKENQILSSTSKNQERTEEVKSPSSKTKKAKKSTKTDSAGTSDKLRRRSNRPKQPTIK